MPGFKKWPGKICHFVEKNDRVLVAELVTALSKRKALPCPVDLVWKQIKPLVYLKRSRWATECICMKHNFDVISMYPCF